MESMGVDPVAAIRGLSFQQGVVYVTIVGLQGVRQASVTKAFEKILGVDEARVRNILKSLEKVGLIHRIRVKGPGRPNVIAAPMEPLRRYLATIVPSAFLGLILRFFSVGVDEMDEELHLPKIRLLYLEMLKTANVSFRDVRAGAPLALAQYLTLIYNAVVSEIFDVIDAHGYREQMSYFASLLPPAAHEELARLAGSTEHFIDLVSSFLGSLVAKARRLRSIQMFARELIETHRDVNVFAVFLASVIAQTSGMLIMEAVRNTEADK